MHWNLVALHWHARALRRYAPVHFAPLLLSLAVAVCHLCPLKEKTNLRCHNCHHAHHLQECKQGRERVSGERRIALAAYVSS